MASKTRKRGQKRLEAYLKQYSDQGKDKGEAVSAFLDAVDASNIRQSLNPEVTKRMEVVLRATDSINAAVESMAKEMNTIEDQANARYQEQLTQFLNECASLKKEIQNNAKQYVEALEVLNKKIEDLNAELVASELENAELKEELNKQTKEKANFSALFEKLDALEKSTNNVITLAQENASKQEEQMQNDL